MSIKDKAAGVSQRSTHTRDVAALEQELSRLAEIYSDTRLLDLPDVVLDVIDDIAKTHGGNMAPAWQAWRDARAAARAKAKE